MEDRIVTEDVIKKAEQREVLEQMFCVCSTIRRFNRKSSPYCVAGH